MLTRRFLLTSTAAAVAMFTLLRFAPAAFAQSADQAKAFIQETANQLTGVVNGPAPQPQKRQDLTQVIDRTVDIEDIARFCLGRFWRIASPAQQKEYVDLFHRVLVVNITGKIGDYQGVTASIGSASEREGNFAVSSIVTRPGNAPAKVDWVVSYSTGSPKIVDVIAEGTSLRITQRQDYASYLSRNGNNVQALIDAMRRQAAG
ncbi:MAG TPA: ABC transporter substrate-binding protein [Acetobacteraceae bacterium]|nr:ABC transporter substrate-binding protein [Acetobacteraceae bacterium]